ncbi:MAG TPA: transglutaminase-like domain-containing protein, partial [Flavisolibacter sp.]|nr:transglutaminase-like domain-containing protein [Flavisolibacter sp.]
VSNLAPVEYEEGSPAPRSRFPYINIVPEQFSHYGFQGNFSTWKSFGNWIKGLYDGLDELPPDRQQFFRQLVAGAPDDREKIRRIYEYLQENFRYVSIQLGIGGFKPFSAAFTDQKKYGDCKALSNFMKAALKSVGIRSCVAIINAGYNEEPVDAAFPANDFNHVVLCVPGKDSIWLECTSNTAEFARLGTFTENRNALLITDEGGVLVSTPPSDPSTNTMTTRTTVTMETDLSATSETVMDATGDLGELMTELAKETKDVQKQTLVYSFGYKQPEDFVFSGEKTGTHQQTVMKMAVRQLPEFSAGQKYFLSPRLQKVWAAKLPKSDSRQLDFYFHYPFVKKDTTVLKLPSGFLPDALPAEKELNTAYGYYHAKTWYNESEKAYYTTTVLTLKKHKVSASDFKAV